MIILVLITRVQYFQQTIEVQVKNICYALKGGLIK